MAKTNKNFLRRNLLGIVGITILVLIVIFNWTEISKRPPEIPSNFKNYSNEELGVSFWYPKSWGKVRLNDAPTMVNLTFTNEHATFQFNKIDALGRGATPADELIKYAGNDPQEYPATEAIYKNGNKVSIWTEYDPCWKASPGEKCLFLTPLPAVASAPLKSQSYEPGVGVYLTDSAQEAVENFKIMMTSFKLIPSTTPVPNNPKLSKTYHDPLLNFTIYYPENARLLHVPFFVASNELGESKYSNAACTKIVSTSNSNSIGSPEAFVMIHQKGDEKVCQTDVYMSSTFQADKVEQQLSLAGGLVASGKRVRNPQDSDLDFYQVNIGNLVISFGANATHGLSTQQFNSLVDTAAQIVNSITF